jgi:regulator of RNase E activity RraB
MWEGIEDVVASSEKGLTDNIPVAIVANNLTFGEATNGIKDKTVNVLDFLYDDDDEDDDDDDEDEDEDEDGRRRRRRRD